MGPMPQVDVSNSPKVGSSLTLAGLNFGACDYSGFASLGQTSAEITLWTSDSSLVIKAAGGAGEAIQASFTVGGGNTTLLPVALDREGFSPPLLSYDTPVLLGVFSELSPDQPLGPGGNGPMADTLILLGAPWFNMTAAGLGIVDLSCSSRLGGTSSMGTSWRSDSVVSTMLAPLGLGAEVVVSYIHNCNKINALHPTKHSSA